MLRLVGHGEYVDGTDRRTDGRTPYRYMTLSAKRGHGQCTVLRMTDEQ